MHVRFMTRLENNTSCAKPPPPAPGFGELQIQPWGLMHEGLTEEAGEGVTDATSTTVSVGNKFIILVMSVLILVS